MIVVGSLTAASGIVLGLPEATITGVVMVVAFLATFISVLIRALISPKIGLRRVIGAQPSSTMAFVGDEVPVDVILRPARRTATAELVEVALDDLAVRKGARSVRLAVRPLRAGETSVANYRVTLRQRGLLRFLPGEWRRTDPLGLLWWSQRLDRGESLLVAPAIVDLPADSIVALAALRPQPERGRELAADPFTFREMRPHQPGEDLRRVHWPTSARRNALMVREPERMRAEYIAPLRMLFDARLSVHENSLEVALSIAASIVVATTGPFIATVVTDAGSTSTESVADTLTCLAAVEREPARTSRGRVRRGTGETTAPLPTDGIHVLVTGPGASFGRVDGHETRPGVVLRSGLAPFDPSQWEQGAATRSALRDAIALGLRSVSAVPSPRCDVTERPAG